MKKITVLLLVLLSLQLVFCTQSKYMNYNGKKWEQLDGNGILVKLNPAIKPFNHIEVNNIDVKISVEKGSDYAAGILIDENLQSFLKWKQEKDTLKFYYDFSGGKYNRWLSKSNTSITIKAPSLTKMVNKGNSDVDIDFSDQSAFYLITNGNALISLTGKVGELTLESKGNADINAKSLAVEKINLSSVGNGDIVVNTKELITKDVKGNNDIKNLYYTVTQTENATPYHWAKKEVVLVNFTLKNKSLLPAKVTVISYRPDEEGNGTNAFVMMSLGSKKFTFPVGTKIYLANSEQVNTVMSGARITDQPPFLTVKKEDAGKTFIIN